MFSTFPSLYKGKAWHELSIGSHVSYADAVTSSGRPAGAARTLLLVAAAIVLVEALAYVVLAVLDVLDLSRDRVGTGIGAGLVLLAYGLSQAWAAWRVTHGDSWARSPLVVTQAIQLLIAWNLRDTSPWLSALLVVASVTALACLLAPPVTRALGADRPV
jgi:hypothetical protein